MVNSTFFLHAHRNESGKVVFHAHPFDKGAEKDDPLAQHQHRKIDLDYINSFEYYLISAIHIDFNIDRDLALELLSKPCLIPNSTFFYRYTTRGPPQDFILA